MADLNRLQREQRELCAIQRFVHHAGPTDLSALTATLPQPGRHAHLSCGWGDKLWLGCVTQATFGPWSHTLRQTDVYKLADVMATSALSIAKRAADVDLRLLPIIEKVTTRPFAVDV